MNFATLKGLTIPQGVVTEVKDASGRMLWTRVKNAKIVLNVSKVNTGSDSGGFILLDIYPKTNGVVTVTYGGLTKTVTDTSGAANPNAQEVYFGTFDGVSDSVETPSSGILTIEGACNGVSVGTYSTGKNSPAAYYSGVNDIIEYSGVDNISYEAFFNCKGLKTVNIPFGVKSIGSGAFRHCDGLTSVTLPASLTSIGGQAFNDCRSLTSITIPASVTSIGDSAFYVGSGAPTTRTVYMQSTVPPVLGSDKVFYLYEGTNHFIVPSGCGAAYKTADIWNTYADYITEA